MDRINVTKTFLPPADEYSQYLRRIWASNQLTNQGQLLREFEQSMKDYLRVKNFHFVSSGTIALQLAIRSLGITAGEIITTPFSYVATASAILWERFVPVFVDIDPDTLCLDPTKLEVAITSRTKAIMPVHVFGYPCDVEAIEDIARRHKLKVIYDGAHAFGVQYKGQQLLSYGDISTCSFHATKLFHTVEGGCVVSKEDTINNKLDLMKRFGHNEDDHQMLGINAKSSEFHAAMGLSNLKYLDSNIKKREKVTGLYNSLLGSRFSRPKANKDTTYNFAYYPILFENENKLLKAQAKLNSKNIFPRRYFYPSLNTLAYLKTHQSCPVSEDIAGRILCLPLYPDLEDEVVQTICEAIA